MVFRGQIVAIVHFPCRSGKLAVYSIYRMTTTTPVKEEEESIIRTCTKLASAVTNTYVGVFFRGAMPQLFQEVSLKESLDLILKLKQHSAGKGDLEPRRAFEVDCLSMPPSCHLQPLLPSPTFPSSATCRFIPPTE